VIATGLLGAVLSIGIMTDWRAGFVLPTPHGAVVTSDCPAITSEDDLRSCLMFPKGEARRVRVALEDWLVSEGFAVGEAPEVGRAFLRETGDSCQGGYLTTLIIEGEPDPARTGLLVITLLEDTCGQPATEERAR
jgi:hypothetical protein